MTSASSKTTKIRAWLHRHNPARGSHWPRASSGVNHRERRAKLKSRIRNLIRRESRQALPPPLSRSASRHTVPASTTAPEPPPPYSPTETSSLLYSQPAEVLLTLPRTDDETPPPGYRNPVGPRSGQAVVDATEVSPGEERRRLEAVFTLHPWNPSWGPQPVSLNEALKRAAFLGNQRLVFTLLDAGAEIKPNDEGVIPEDGPIHAALYGPSPRIAVDLLNHDSISPDVRNDLLELRNTLGLTPLHIAAENGQSEIARELIQLGSSVDAVDRFGRTALHIAARYGKTETIDMLLDQGADSKINRQLWIRAADCSHSQDALGQYSSVSRTLQDALDRWSQRIRESARERRMSMGQVSLSPSFASYSSQMLGASLGESMMGPNENRRAGDRRSWTPSVENCRPGSGGVYSSMLDDMGPAHFAHRSLHGHSSSDLGPDQFRRRSLASSGGPSTPRRKAPPQTLVFTPEYQRWRRGLETLQAESRAQKEKNRQMEQRIMGR
ncbi:ankyrin repeat-containing domain protein [Rhypophila decipiens]|uniref:Ankyrin repeat-containing domain protein n=1 Tax=Rhypophila decipiens TaxID=261697 RepID=A0AAN7B9F9_9PEZI|nr:ankyrin repeat-containing domain protein [Rhypophila decipiens]